MPAQPANDAGSLTNEILAVINKQAQLAFGAVEMSDRQIGLAKRRTSDGERVDRVGLPVRTSSLTPNGTAVAASATTNGTSSTAGFRARSASKRCSGSYAFHTCGDL